MNVSSQLLQRVRTNLLYMNSWTDVQIHDSGSDPKKTSNTDIEYRKRIPFITGFPPQSLHPQPATAADAKSGSDCGNDSPATLEFVFPVCIDSKDLTMQQIDSIFVSISQTKVDRSLPIEESAEFGRPARIILAIVSDDGTIVYYFVHDGLVKPKKN